MRVAETVRCLIAEWPTLYQTRADALLRLFDGDAATWVDGELLIHDSHRRHTGSPFTDETKERTAWEQATSPARRASAAGMLVLVRRQNAETAFVCDNAAVLAEDTSLALTFPPRFAGQRFADLPEHVTAEWLDAAKELAHAIVAYQYVDTGRYAANYVRMQEQAIAASQRIARQFLERFRVVDIPAHERTARREALEREARALGFTLVDAVPDAAAASTA